MTPARAEQTTAPASILDEHRSRPGLLLALLGQEAMRRLRAAHTAHNLKPRQFQILGLLHDHGGLPQRELMQQMDIDPSILVTLLNPLEADGLVARERDPADRRRHLVTLTPAGERALVSASGAQTETEDELFAALSDEQRQQLAGLLLALRDGLAGDADGACGGAGRRTRDRRQEARAST
jgi:DNA-binding MarR family transcriptional regulator